MICERCGNELSENASICSACGTVNSLARAANQPSTAYGPFPPFGNSAPYRPQQDYTPLSSNPVAPGYVSPQPNAGYESYPPFSPPQPGYMPPPQQNHDPAYHANTGYAPGPINVVIVNTASTSGKNESALIMEVLFSLFGIFGIGWLMSGEATAGAILLICSVMIYWPILLLGTIITFGFALICLGPMAIAAIILNALLLNNNLNRKAQILVMTPSPMQTHNQQF